MPKFFNPQPVTIGIPDGKGGQRTIASGEIVEGEFPPDYIHPRGPLHPFHDSPSLGRQGGSDGRSSSFEPLREVPVAPRAAGLDPVAVPPAVDTASHASSPRLSPAVVTAAKLADDVEEPSPVVVDPGTVVRLQRIVGFDLTDEAADYVAALRNGGTADCPLALTRFEKKLRTVAFGSRNKRS